MKFFETIEHWMPGGRFALPASLIAAIWGLLAFAAPAGAEIGEAVDDAAAAPAAVVETQAPVVEEVPVVEGEQTQKTAPVAAAPEPVVEVAAQEASSVTESVGPAPVGDPVSPSGLEPVPSQSPSPQVATAGQEASRIVRDLGNGPVESIAPAADRLPVVRTGMDPLLQGANNDLQRVTEPLFEAVTEPLFQVTALVQESLNSIGPATVGALLPPVGPLLGAAEPSADGPLGFAAPPQPGSSSFHRSDIGGPTLQRPPEPGGVEAVAAGSRALAHPSGGTKARPTATGDASAIHADTATDRSRFQGPTPLDVPLPAPESPGAIAPGSGGPTFVPIAALLALLALVAPAVRRRLGEVSDFRPPTPFVCALERPG